MLDQLKALWYSKQTVDGTHYSFTFSLYFHKTKKDLQIVYVSFRYLSKFILASELEYDRIS